MTTSESTERYAALLYTRLSGGKRKPVTCGHKHRSKSAAARCGREALSEILMKVDASRVMDAGWSVARKAGRGWMPVE